MPKRTDTNHASIVEGLRAVGASVRSTASIGRGFPDLVVGFRGVNYLLEVKDAARPPSRRRLTPDEHKFQQGWKGIFIIVTSLEDALKTIGASQE